MPLSDHARYINPYTDFGFKRLFGSEVNKDILIDFLISFLRLESSTKKLFCNMSEDEKMAFVVDSLKRLGDSQEQIDYHLRECILRIDFTKEERYAVTYMIGYAEGYMQGRAETKTKIARSLKALGVPLETLAQGLGLSIEDEREAFLHTSRVNASKMFANCL